MKIHTKCELIVKEKKSCHGTFKHSSNATFETNVEGQINMLDRPYFLIFFMTHCKLAHPS